MGGMGGFAKSPPIPFNSNSNKQSVQETIASHQKMIGTSKKILGKMKQEHMGAV